MRIDIIDTDQAFDDVRENWDRVFMSDPYAQHFLSWVWLKRYLFRRKRWFILALREKAEGSPYVAFFPLRIVTLLNEKTGQFYDEIIMAGNFAADYTGFLTMADYEEHAVAGFCSYIRQQNWTNLKIEYFYGPPGRREAMIRALQGPNVMFRDSTPKSLNDINNCICPGVPLPDRFDAYLDTRMSSQSRQKLRRFLRKVESDPDWKITFATPQTIKRDITILFDFWRTKWAPFKGKERTERLIAGSREMLMDCFVDGNLDVPVLWYQNKPLGALANIVDRQKMAMLFYVTGRDESWKTPSPGFVLHGYCIRRAIDNGFRYYDFLRGNEPYKYVFGPNERHISCTMFRSRSGQNLGDILNPRSIRFVYEKALQLYKEGKKANAEVAFKQVVDAAPEHYGARFGLANLLFEKGKLPQAEQAFDALAKQVESPVPVLMRLGETQLALHRYDEASVTFQNALKLSPFNREALYKRGVALTAAGKTIEALETFSTLRGYYSDNPAHREYTEKAKLAFERLMGSLGIGVTKLPTIPTTPKMLQS